MFVSGRQGDSERFKPPIERLENETILPYHGMCSCAQSNVVIPTLSCADLCGHAIYTKKQSTGYVDDVHGYNFVDNNGSPTAKGTGHGTHVAGIIAASAGGSGTVGVAPRVRIMVIEFLDTQGNGFLSESFRAINYGVANGAQARPQPRHRKCTGIDLI
eukprot:scaffold514270_cov56-Prasinocladus_malaysianus.AAC.1